MSDLKQKNVIRKKCSQNRSSKRLWVLLCGLFYSIFLSLAHAEVATATDQATVEDAVILGKVVPNHNLPIPNVAGQQPNPTKTATAQDTPATANNQVQVANDMAEGETTRQLPTLNSPIVDQANVLSSLEKQQLSDQIRKIYNQGKAQIGIIIVPTTGQEGIFDFAMRVAEQWKLGSAKQDNGLLIAVAVNDRRIHIATGYGLEGVLPDIIASRIIRNQISPEFKLGQYGRGLIAGVTEIERILNMDPETAQKAADELKDRQAQAIHEQEAQEKTMMSAFIILIVGVFASFIVGNRLSATVAGITGTAAGLIYGADFVTSLVLGFGIFFLLITSLAQLIFQMFMSGGGGRGGGGGFGSGGGYSGGGGGFGGGGASGSW